MSQSQIFLRRLVLGVIEAIEFNPRTVDEKESEVGSHRQLFGLVFSSLHSDL
jgi:hypothetical protein